jgi:probable H4MPT-linked C1 transfer pathway protein
LAAFLGLDIGGANTKAALLNTENKKITNYRSISKYFPMWKNSQNLPNLLLNLKEQLSPAPLDALAITLTAELSDAYSTKQAGISHILSCVTQVFFDIPCYVLTTDAKLLPLEAVWKNLLEVGGANWAATGWVIAQYFQDAVALDVGSTSTSIIPIIKGKVAAQGKGDLEKLVCGELVYTGSLRTNIAAIVQTLPTKYGPAGVASELFALSGDVHLVLGNISEAAYSCETADGRGKALPEAYARLARVVCADTQLLSTQEIHAMAKHIYAKQIRQITKGLVKVYKYTKAQSVNQVPVVVMGVGKTFLAHKAAKKVGVDVIVDLDTLLPIGAGVAVPALGVAWRGASNVLGEIPVWTFR